MKPTLPQLGDKLREVRERRAAAKQAFDARDTEDAKLEDGLVLLILDDMNAGTVGLSTILSNGDRMSFTRKVKTQYRIEAGESDKFFAWVKAHNKTELLQRRILQEAMAAEVAAAGTVPVGVHSYSTVTLGTSITRAAPKV